MKLPSLPKLRSRSAFAQALELGGFALISFGVYRIVGLGVALVVGGLLLALLAFEVER